VEKNVQDSRNRIWIEAGTVMPASGVAITDRAAMATRPTIFVSASFE